MKFIHLTDPHLVARSREIFGFEARDRLAQAVESINARFADAELCMVTGDITHLGEAAAYGETNEILSRLNMPWHLLMGNHDDRIAMRQEFPDAPWRDDGFLQYTLETPAGVFIALDTVDDGRGPGYLCEARLRWFREQLLKTADAGSDVFVFMHHPPFDSGIHGMDAQRLTNAEDMIAVLQGFTHIRHLFFGHLHRTCHGAWRGLPFSTVKATSFQIGLVLDNETPVQGTVEDPAYAIVLVDQDSVVVHDHSYFDDEKIFDFASGPPNPEIAES